MIKEVKDC